MSTFHDGRAVLQYRDSSSSCSSDVMLQVRKLGMMAGGTGITPMLQIISAVMRESGGFGNSSQIEMSLIFANKSEDDILLRDMIEKLVRAARAASEKAQGVFARSLCSTVVAAFLFPPQGAAPQTRKKKKAFPLCS